MTIRTTRRGFLKHGSMALAGFALSSAHASELAVPKRRKLGIAVAGIGNFAAFALPRIATSSHARVAGFVSGDRAKAEHFAREYGVNPKHIYGYHEIERLGEDPAIDLVYLTLPVGLHAEFAVRAMQAGKHVLSEKTLAGSAADARRAMAVAERTGRHFMVAYRAYFGPAYAAVRRLIESREYGEVIHIDAHKGFSIDLPPDNWRFDRRLGGGGSLVDIGVYSVQAARLFAGAEPVEVAAQLFSSGDPRFRHNEESVVFTLRFANGVLASGSASWSYRLQNRLRIGLRKAWLELQPASSVTGQVLRISDSQGHQGLEQPVTQQDQLPLMFDHVADVVLGGAAPLIPASEGLRDLEIIEALYAAAASGRTVPLRAPGPL